MSPSLPSFFVALALSLIFAPTSLAQRKTLPYNFTLAAVNTTLPNANGTGVPLVLGSAGAIPGASFYITSLRAYDRYGNWHTNATALSSGNEMGWLSTTLGGSESNQFAVFHATRHHRYASLAVHASDAPSSPYTDSLWSRYTDSLWSLCPSTQFRGKNEVVYNVSATYQYYPFNVSDCYKVTLQVVPLRRWGADEVEGGDVDGLDGADGEEGGDDEEGGGDENGGDLWVQHVTNAAVAVAASRFVASFVRFVCASESMSSSRVRRPLFDQIFPINVSHANCALVQRSSPHWPDIPRAQGHEQPSVNRGRPSKPIASNTNIFSSFFALAVVLATTTVSLAQSAASPAPLKTLPYHFTLAALNTTLPNVNDTGVPLVISGHGGIHGATFFTTTTWASTGWPSAFPSLALVNGALRAYDGTQNANASKIMSDEQMWWIESGDPWNPNIDQFTALHATQHHKYASLAAYGHDSLWSLCVLQLGDSNVIYNVSADPSAPIPDKGCHKVILQIIPEHH
ncbi:hypothetical protein GGF50DRAFT_59741 [Schizophyllum commune]